MPTPGRTGLRSLRIVNHALKMETAFHGAPHTVTEAINGIHMLYRLHIHYLSVLDPGLNSDLQVTIGRFLG